MSVMDPNEIINHGKNGYLIERNNIDSLAQHMVDIIENPMQHVKIKIS